MDLRAQSVREADRIGATAADAAAIAADWRAVGGDMWDSCDRYEV